MSKQDPGYTQLRTDCPRALSEVISRLSLDAILSSDKGGLLEILSADGAGRACAPGRRLRGTPAGFPCAHLNTRSTVCHCTAATHLYISNSRLLRCVTMRTIRARPEENPCTFERAIFQTPPGLFRVPSLLGEL